MPGGSARLIDLPVVSDPRGDLTFVEGRNHVPFDIARVYYLYNVPVDAERGGHAHKVLQQVVFARGQFGQGAVDEIRHRHDRTAQAFGQGLEIFAIFFFQQARHGWPVGSIRGRDPFVLQRVRPKQSGQYSQVFSTDFSRGQYAQGATR